VAQQGQSITELCEEILNLRKYRDLDLPAETVQDLLARELPLYKTNREAVKAVRRKLHNIIAPYLGDPAYEQASADLGLSFESGDESQVRETLHHILEQHASTRERLPHLDEFYERIFALTGVPETILDLACGLNPLSFPWMGLPGGAAYHAYDIHLPRVKFINHYFRLQGLDELAEQRDILVAPPLQEADAAFLFKEAHRLEQRQRGCNIRLWDALNVRFLLVSLPAVSLTGRRNLAEKHRRLVHNTLAGKTWPVTEIQVHDEIVFCIEKE
jgi:16S rRNA (guanine(1405)-N(7))-methyltransferase